MKTRYVSLVLGVLFGIGLGGTAMAAGITAIRSTQPIYVDGSRVSLTAYSIGGNNYVKLRDIGQAVDMNVYWNGSAVQIDTGSPYTGEAPAPVSASVQPTVQATPTPATQDVEAMRQDIVDRTNAVRIANGQKALPTDPMLMRAAQVRAEEMAATGCYSHTRPDGSEYKTASDTRYVSENIHRIAFSVAEKTEGGLPAFCVLGWRCSEGHLRNMLRENCSAIGVGIAKGWNELFQEESWYCVEWMILDGYQITWVDTPKIP